MRLVVRHLSSYRYDPPAERAAIRLKVFPSQFEGQNAAEWRVTVNDEPVAPMLMSGFGDEEAIWLQHSACEQIEIIAEGVVETEDKAGVVKGLPRTPPVGVFLRSTSLTKPDDDIRALAEDSARDDPLEELHAISAAVRAAVEYRSGSTDASTSAAAALKQGAGVCQDHAHLFIAATHARGRPARYAAGYLLGSEGNEDLHETHAWAEAYVDGLGWVGFDASNGVCPTDKYIRLACGLDARGAAPIRGSVLGGGGETLHASVAIEQAQQ